jgi:hypothetical protein
MKEVLSVFTFGVGALCFVVFVTVFKPTAASAVYGTSKPEYLTSRPLATDRTSNDVIEPQRNRTKSNENAGKSTKPVDILPLITVPASPPSAIPARLIKESFIRSNVERDALQIF